MTWLDKMNTLQTKLVEASPITIGDELVNALNLFRSAYEEVLQNGSVKLHLSPFWAEAGFVVPPVNSTIVNYMLLIHGNDVDVDKGGGLWFLSQRWFKVLTADGQQ